MGFSEAMKWWEEWQLRVLVLASLFLQYFLFAVAPLRKCCIPGWLRFLTWTAYLGSDAVVIYALATLFNQHTMQDGWVSTHRSSVELQALWAPVLLTHLGGQYDIIAYNIEDNKRWRLRLLTAFSQITVAIYVFHKSWSGYDHMLLVAMSMFGAGIMRCLDKPWTQKRANIAAGPWSEYGYDWEPWNIPRCSSPDFNSLEEYMQAAVERVQDDDEGLRHPCPFELGKPYDLFVDVVPPYNLRLDTLTLMVWWQRRPRFGKPWVHGRLQEALSTMFDRLFTWQDPARMAGKYFSWRNHYIFRPRFVFAYGTVNTIIMLSLGPESPDQKYNETDVKVTYALICCTAALELCPGIISLFISYCVSICIGDANDPWHLWPDRAAQYNLIGYLDRNRRHWLLRGLASLLLCKDRLDQLWCMAPCKSAATITGLVYDHIIDGWANYIRSAGTYQRFNDFRGQWTLRREWCTGGLIEASLQRPFDESVLIWHLATDLCFHVHEHDDNAADEEDAAGRCRERARVISNYLVYLLFVNPEMLVAGAKRSLFRDAYKELRDMSLEDTADSDEAPSPQLREKKLAEEIMARGAGDGSRTETRFVHDAWALARELMDIGKQEAEEEATGGGDGKKMWRVIQGVWVEMLCFSACRCKGYLHAKSLGKGGEYLSYVWLLMSYMGLEPLSEKLQRTTAELQDETDNHYQR